MAYDSNPCDPFAACRHYQLPHHRIRRSPDSPLMPLSTAAVFVPPDTGQQCTCGRGQSDNHHPQIKNWTRCLTITSILRPHPAQDILLGHSRFERNRRCASCLLRGWL